MRIIVVTIGNRNPIKKLGATSGVKKPSNDCRPSEICATVEATMTCQFHTYVILSKMIRFYNIKFKTENDTKTEQLKSYEIKI